MTQYGFYFDQTRCIGCHTCAVACKDWYDINAGPVNWMRVKEILKGKYPELKMAYISIACNHCADPPCVKACPTNAINKREKDGIVIVNSEKCLGYKECGAKCLNVCPWNAPQFLNHEKAKMEKCNLCFERLEKGKQAICVEACPMFALDVGPIEDLKQKYIYTMETEGFKSKDNYKPSIIFNPKKFS